MVTGEVLVTTWETREYLIWEQIFERGFAKLTKINDIEYFMTMKNYSLYYISAESVRWLNY